MYGRLSACGKGTRTSVTHWSLNTRTLQTTDGCAMMSSVTIIIQCMCARACVRAKKYIIIWKHLHRQWDHT